MISISAVSLRSFTSFDDTLKNLRSGLDKGPIILIHVECQWQDNLRTVEGEIVHEHCHDENFSEKRNSLLICRGMRIVSRLLGITGQCDVVEFHQDVEGVVLAGRTGYWRPMPVEYKRGKPKEHDADVLQLCAQAMCLEEMLCCDIRKGCLFYDMTHRREEIMFSPELRKRVQENLIEMHELYHRGYTPKVKTSKNCRECSLRDICLPVLLRHKMSVAEYYSKHIGEW